MKFKFLEIYALWVTLVGWKQCGSLYLARNKDRMTGITRTFARLIVRISHLVCYVFEYELLVSLARVSTIVKFSYA